MLCRKIPRVGLRSHGTGHACFSEPGVKASSLERWNSLSQGDRPWPARWDRGCSWESSWSIPGSPHPSSPGVGIGCGSGAGGGGERLPCAFGNAKDELMPWQESAVPACGSSQRVVGGLAAPQKRAESGRSLGLRMLRQHFAPRYRGFKHPPNLLS